MKKGFRNAGIQVNPFLAWSLIIALTLIWSDCRITAEVINDGDATSGTSAENDDNVLFFDWAPPVDTILGGSKWIPSSTTAVGQPSQENSLNQFIFAKNKRSVFGILGLVTKRPHKTAAQIQHLPPQDAFMSVRGKKSPLFPLPFQRAYSMVLPSYSFQ